jgi:hypothetical protein
MSEECHSFYIPPFFVSIEGIVKGTPIVAYAKVNTEIRFHDREDRLKKKKVRVGKCFSGTFEFVMGDKKNICIFVDGTEDYVYLPISDFDFALAIYVPVYIPFGFTSETSAKKRK